MLVAVLIDGGYLRAEARKYRYNPDFIEKFTRSILAEDEQLFRAFYYDCDPFVGELELPVSGKKRKYEARGWLDILATKELFAVRRGVLKFRGFKPKRVPVASSTLSDDEFRPDFEQKGVDMRIGLDIATFSSSGAVDRVILVTGDTDCVPAMKHARIAGLQMVIVQLPTKSLSRELLWHTDYCRQVEWPKDAELFQPSS
ncbi:MAG: NYN domain-containing protein [Ahrensia sp.]|nr:NYN domain-containing protein [Ahrensia sp.]